ncbi:MAG: tRNA (adenosine(37)-N6)-threonylcarbamoyltransferase complex ATPase subunit type 1 TsaE [Cyanophyceae cyanobacterium]
MVEIAILLANAEATRGLGRGLGQLLPAGSVILLAGALGAGKTTLVAGIGEGLGIREPIVSPTFTLVNEYTQGRLPLYHLDLYRLSAREVESVYPEIYWEGVECPPGITAIEWPCRLSYSPSDYLAIQLADAEPGRIAQITPVGIEVEWSELQERYLPTAAQTIGDDRPK